MWHMEFMQYENVIKVCKCRNGCEIPPLHCLALFNKCAMMHNRQRNGDITPLHCLASLCKCAMMHNWQRNGWDVMSWIQQLNALWAAILISSTLHTTDLSKEMDITK